jgi:hypothetical protein
VDENNLKEKLRRIEALFAGAATPGERDAAGAARERILQRLRDLIEGPRECKGSVEARWLTGECLLASAVLPERDRVPFQRLRMKVVNLVSMTEPIAGQL